MTSRLVLNVCCLQSPDLGGSRDTGCLPPKLYPGTPWRGASATLCSAQLQTQALEWATGTQKDEGGLQAVTEIKPGHTSISGLDRFC